MKEHKKTLQISEENIKRFNDFLNSEESIPGYRGGDFVDGFVVDFGNGFQADIDLINSDDCPYLNCVLFEHGCEIALLEPQYELQGEYIWKTSIHGEELEFTLIIESKDSPVNL